MAAKLKNEYYAREVATPRECFVCHKDTTCCLATLDVSDFVYNEPAAVPTVTQEDIDRVKKEYEDRQAAKKNKDKAKDGAEKKESPKPSPVVAAAPPEPKKPRKFALHRDFFAMRLDAKRTKEARSVSSSLPSLPKTLPSSRGEEVV